jgi:DNA modification methylase
MDRIPPGQIRDTIVRFLAACDDAVSAKEIEAIVIRKLGEVPLSSIRSYLSLNTPDVFERTERGYYRLRNVASTGQPLPINDREQKEAFNCEKAVLIHSDCFEWLRTRTPKSVQAIVTDPPYGLVEYSEDEQRKLRLGRGGVWRIPPSFDGSQRSPLPRFTTLSEIDLARMFEFFEGFGLLAYKVLVPGANVVVASNPLVSHIVASALSHAGLESRGAVVRLVMTMRGGDRPKNAHSEFPEISVMPRSMWEPWLVFRRPLDGRVQDNLRIWKTGGFRRPSDDKPFGDVIKSHPTEKTERKIAPHPSLKPQKFLREIIRAALPLGEGVILDPFAGSGSTLAAANAVGYTSIGIEKDEGYYSMAKAAISKLSSL